MNEMDRHNLKSGSRVKYYDIDRWEQGEVTIVRENDAKVIFDSPCDLNYDYYPIDKLELIDNEQ
jgi:hypothetical protein